MGEIYHYYLLVHALNRVHFVCPASEYGFCWYITDLLFDTGVHAPWLLFCSLLLTINVPSFLFLFSCFAQVFVLFVCCCCCFFLFLLNCSFVSFILRVVFFIEDEECHFYWVSEFLFVGCFFFNLCFKKRG